MTSGEDNMGSREEKCSSSTFSDDALLLVIATGVITLLRLIREPEVDTFWKKFSFPPNFWVSFPSSGSHFVDCTEEDCGGINFIYWLMIHISE